jgi:hypothetical protein
MDDPCLELHYSADLSRTLLSALAKMSEGVLAALTAEQRTQVAQAIDILTGLNSLLSEITGREAQTLPKT